jgi:hypothetical protein
LIAGPTPRQTGRLTVGRNITTSVSYSLTLFFARVLSSTLKIEATRSSETAVYIKPARRHVPEDGIFKMTTCLTSTLCCICTHFVQGSVSVPALVCKILITERGHPLGRRFTSSVAPLYVERFHCAWTLNLNYKYVQEHTKHVYRLLKWLLTDNQCV